MTWALLTFFRIMYYICTMQANLCSTTMYVVILLMLTFDCNIFFLFYVISAQGNESSGLHTHKKLNFISVGFFSRAMLNSNATQLWDYCKESYLAAVKTNRLNSYTPRIMANQVSLNLRWFTFCIKHTATNRVQFISRLIALIFQYTTEVIVNFVDLTYEFTRIPI